MSNTRKPRKYDVDRDKFMTIAEVATSQNVCIMTVRMRLKYNCYPNAVKINRAWFIPKDECANIYPMNTPPDAEKDKYMSRHELKERLGVSESHLTQVLNSGYVGQKYKFGFYIYVDRERAEKYIEYYHKRKTFTKTRKGKK